MATLVVVRHGNLGYGVNKKKPPYLEGQERGDRRESEIRSATATDKRGHGVFDTGNEIRS